MIDVKIGHHTEITDKAEIISDDLVDDKVTMIITKEHQPSRQRELLEKERYDSHIVNDTDTLIAFAKSKVEKYKTDETYFTLTILPSGNTPFKVPL